MLDETTETTETTLDEGSLKQAVQNAAQELNISESLITPYLSRMDKTIESWYNYIHRIKIDPNLDETRVIVKKILSERKSIPRPSTVLSNEQIASLPEGDWIQLTFFGFNLVDQIGEEKFWDFKKEIVKRLGLPSREGDPHERKEEREDPSYKEKNFDADIALYQKGNPQIVVAESYEDRYLRILADPEIFSKLIYDYGQKQFNDNQVNSKAA